MPKIKGLSLVNLRTLIRKKYLELEKPLLSRLTEELKILYMTAITSTWTPYELQNGIYIPAADLIYPNNPKRFELMGKSIAELTYTGIYQLFLKIPTPDFIVARWVNLWFLHHDSGNPSYEKINAAHYILYVKNLPTLPKEISAMVSGHIQEVLELIGVPQPAIILKADNPLSWEWHVQWSQATVLRPHSPWI